MDDLISRSALSEEISTLTMTVTGLRAGKGVLRDFIMEYRKSVLRIVDEAPTIGPESLRPKGRWVKIGADEYTCDKCHAIFEYESVIRCGYNFCPNCGARMMEEQHER